MKASRISRCRKDTNVSKFKRKKIIFVRIDKGRKEANVLRFKRKIKFCF